MDYGPHQRDTTPRTSFAGPVLSRCAFAALNSDFTSGFLDMLGVYVDAYFQQVSGGQGCREQSREEPRAMPCTNCKIGITYFSRY